METISIEQLSSVMGGEVGAPATPGINEETYAYGGQELGKIGGELLGSETLGRHLGSAGEQVGRGIYRAGSWLGEQVGRAIYGN